MLFEDSDLNKNTFFSSAGSVKTLKVKCNKDYNVQNDESQHGHCTNERRVRKRYEKVRRDVV